MAVKLAIYRLKLLKQKNYGGHVYNPLYTLVVTEG